MESKIFAQSSGKIKLFVKAGELVDSGKVMLSIE